MDRLKKAKIRSIFSTLDPLATIQLIFLGSLTTLNKYYDGEKRDYSAIATLRSQEPTQKVQGRIDSVFTIAVCLFKRLINNSIN